MYNAEQPLAAEAFTHIRMIVGTIVGLCISRILIGVAKFIQHPNKKELYGAHLLWIAFTLLTVIHFLVV